MSLFRLPLKYFVLAATGSLFLVSTPVFANFSLDDWSYFKEILMPPTFNETSLISMPPDTEIFSNSSPKLIDARIIDNNGLEIPYILDVATGEHQERLLHTDLEHNRDVSGKYTTLTADLGRQGILHNRIEIHTQVPNFNRLGIVEISNNYETWSVVSKQNLYSIKFDNLGYIDANKGIDYPTSTSRYVRVFVSDESEGPLEINGGQVFFSTSTDPKKNLKTLSKFTSRQDDTNKTTTVEVDLGSKGLHSHQIVLEISDTNFSRNASVQSSEDSEEWKMVEEVATIYSLNTPNFVSNRLDISYKEQTSRYLRLVIENGDNLPLNITGANVWSYERRFLFTANPKNNYRIYYGNLSTEAPYYDIEHILPYLNLDELPSAELGPQFKNPIFDRKLIDMNTWLFPTVIGIATLSLGLVLFNIFRKASERLKPPSDDN